MISQRTASTTGRTRPSPSRVKRDRPDRRGFASAVPGSAVAVIDATDIILRAAGKSCPGCSGHEMPRCWPGTVTVSETERSVGRDVAVDDQFVQRLLHIDVRLDHPSLLERDACLQDRVPLL